VAAGDPDCDGFSGPAEAFLYTHPFDSCADTPTANDEDDDKWPADFNDNQVVNTLDLVVYATALNHSLFDPQYVFRADLNINGVINTLDLIIYATALNRMCGP
jgi:hypothetical protein